MSNIHPHDLHQVIRTWLLAEDPYGMNRGGSMPGGRVEPPMGRPAGPPVEKGAVDVRGQGERVVERALAPGARAEPTVSGETAHAAGIAAVDQEMDKANTEQWKDKMAGRKAQRAQAGSAGRAAVADAISPAKVRAMIAEQGKPSWTSPEESAAFAGHVGENAVAGAMPPPPTPAGWQPPVGKRLKDPVDEDDKSPE